jgi:hypothetical protein
MSKSTLKATEKYADAAPFNKVVEVKIARALTLDAAIKKIHEERIKPIIENQIQPLEDELNAIKLEFEGIFEFNKIELIETPAGKAKLAVTNSYSVLPESIEKLKKIFGEQYPVFVQEKPAYGCTAAFKKLLADADYKFSEKIREAVAIKKTKAVKFEYLNPFPKSNGKAAK